MHYGHGIDVCNQYRLKPAKVVLWIPCANDRFKNNILINAKYAMWCGETLTINFEDYVKATENVRK